MNSYNKPIAAPASVTINTSSNAALVFATPNANRVGYRFTNTGSATVYLMEVPVGTATPTVATVIATPSFIVPVGETISSGARDLTDVYSAAGAVASGVAQELS